MGIANSTLQSAGGSGVRYTVLMHERTYVVVGVVTLLLAAGAFWLVAAHQKPVANTGGSGAGGIMPFNSGILGTVLLGPTCPVMRTPPDPQCADKPYTTTVSVYRANSTKVFASMKTSADGTFHFALPPGAYTVTATGGTPFPRCGNVSVSVDASGFKNADVSCDSGIR